MLIQIKVPGKALRCNVQIAQARFVAMHLQQLLVVIDPQATNQLALERALWLARKTHAQLHLLLVEYSTALEASHPFDDAFRARARAARLEERSTWLEELVAPLRREGLQLDIDVRWGKPLHALVEEKAAEISADLVFSSMPHDSLLRRLLLSNSSWQLIRHCPAPLWLVQPAEWSGQRLCAALDPLHSADKPAQLDHQLIRSALQLSQSLGMQAHFVHSYAPLPRSLVFDAELVSNYEHYVALSQKQHRQAFEQLLAGYSVAAAERHLLEGFAEEAVPRFVEEQKIDLLLMGAISRGHLETALIGHTAERLLDKLGCDLLILKPETAEEGAPEQ